MRLIYALIMICGFAFLLWSIDKSMPVYADAVLTSDYPIYENVAGVAMSESELKECEEELASCKAQLDSCLPSEFGPPQATPLYYEDPPVIRR